MSNFLKLLSCRASLRPSSFSIRHLQSAESPPPWGFRAFSAIAQQQLCITENCVRRVQEIIEEEGSGADRKMLRVSVEGGGCSGFQYVFALDDKLNSNDRVFEKDGVKVVVDEISMDFVKGATIDYVEEIIRSSFMVTQNPNASGGCGCGSSFNVKQL